MPPEEFLGDAMRDELLKGKEMFTSEGTLEGLQPAVRERQREK